MFGKAAFLLNKPEADKAFLEQMGEVYEVLKPELRLPEFNRRVSEVITSLDISAFINEITESAQVYTGPCATVQTYTIPRALDPLEFKGAFQLYNVPVQSAAHLLSEQVAIKAYSLDISAKTDLIGLLEAHAPELVGIYVDPKVSGNEFVASLNANPDLTRLLASKLKVEVDGSALEL